MKLKDFIEVLDRNYELGVVEGDKRIFECKSDSNVLSHYAEREIKSVSLTPSMIDGSFIIITLKEEVADNE